MSLATAYRTKKRCMAKGGEVGPETGVHTPKHEGSGTSKAGAQVRYAHNRPWISKGSEGVRRVHKDKLAELQQMPKPTSGKAGFAEGGDVVSGIMRKRYSKGGMVANDVGESEADKEPAEFDDLVLRDELEDDSSAGNEHGDPVKSAMRKRKK